MLWDDGSGKRDEKKEDRVQTASRLPKSLHAYLMAGNENFSRSIETVVRFHKMFFERLAADRIRIQRFALDEGLNWPGQVPEILARLVIRGLDDADRRRK